MSEIQQIVITLFNHSMFSATGESDKPAFIIELTAEQSAIIKEWANKGYSILAITQIEKP